MNVAFIPVRGGSKSIPFKNIKPICGKPLVYWTVKATCECQYIDKVYVATDSEEIKEVVNSFCKEFPQIMKCKIEVIERSAESAQDTASTEFAMLEFAANYEFDNIVLVQATSPLLTGEDLKRGMESFQNSDTDSVLSVVRQKRFRWNIDSDGFVTPMNYDVFNRPRRQEFAGDLVENGAFYISSKENLLRSKNRISGRIRAVEMRADSFFEIDEPSDWVIIEALMQKNGMKRSTNFYNVQMFLTDCDGCLTDGGMYYTERGDELKKFNTKDGMGFQLLREKGIITGIITGEDMDLNRRRASKLKLDEVYGGVKDKLSVIKDLCAKYGIRPEDVVYVGDDINDLAAMQFVGHGCTVADAQKDIRDAATYITTAKGGDGAIREIIDLILSCE
ncbi:MAG: acylneuraminate cytidylyltransferase [Ruminococcus flavefaciens]|nr:acylneuraminate cytidylyltransferase [Ruminococcus flavefaciens]